ncbi:MAG: ADP-ribosylglycohydrolase family protein [bacterium]
MNHELTARDRARGALLGAAVGDAMGAPVEGRTAEEIYREHGAITGFVRPPKGGTDDTDFTLFNAYLLTTYGSDIRQEQVEAEWRDKFLSGKHFYRPGGFSDVVAVNNLREGMETPDSGRFNHQMWSDGVAMAISPAGIVSPGDREQAARLADTLGSVSNARDGLYTARAVAAAVSAAMTGAGPTEMMDVAIAVTPEGSWTRRQMEVAREIALSDGGAGSGTGHRALEGEAPPSFVQAVNEKLILHYWPWADLASEAVPVAFAFFLHYRGVYREAVPASVAIGRDADTIAAICGSLCGAYGGEDSIPAEWRQTVTVSEGASIGFVAHQPIVEIADRLAALAGGETSHA